MLAVSAAAAGQTTETLSSLLAPLGMCFTYHSARPLCHRLINVLKSACICRKGDDLATAGSQTPGTSYALPDAHGNVSGMHLIHEHTSYSQNDGLVTPAQKEGRRFGPSLQPAESITSSQVQVRSCHYV